jgi:hypothetical protein
MAILGMMTMMKNMPKMMPMMAYPTHEVCEELPRLMISYQVYVTDRTEKHCSPG